jgi:hypothetical protein
MFFYMTIFCQKEKEKNWKFKKEAKFGGFQLPEMREKKLESPDSYTWFFIV